MSSVSIAHVPTLSMTEMQAEIRESMISGDAVGFLAASGTGKTTTLYGIAGSIGAGDLVDHPLNLVQPGSVDQVKLVMMSCPAYDAYTFRGVIVPGDSYVDQTTGEKKTSSTLTTPQWFGDTKQALADNPTAHVVLGIDEVNKADDEFQACMLQLLSEGRMGPHVFTPEEQARLSFIFLGNREEDVAGAFTLIGPLAQRAWWYQACPTAKEVLDHLDAQGASSPEVHWFLNQYPQTVVVPGLTEDGTCPQMNPTDGGGEYAIEHSVNATNPRRWMQVSRRLQRMRAQNMPTAKRRKILTGAVPAPVAMELVTAMDLADSFATMEEIVADPQGATVPDGALLEAMQVRSLMTKINEANVDPFIHYSQRLSKAASSGIVAYMTKLTRDGGGDPMRASGSSNNITPNVRAKLINAFMKEYCQTLAGAMGIGEREDIPVPAPSGAQASPTAMPAPVMPVPPAAPAAPASAPVAGPNSMPPVATPPIPAVPAVPAAPQAPGNQTGLMAAPAPAPAPAAPEQPAAAPLPPTGGMDW